MVWRYGIREYFQPRTLREASETVNLDPEGTRLLAGGTDLLNKLPPRSDKGIRLVSLKRIAELRGITCNREGDMFIGAMTSHTDVAESPAVRRNFPALAKASSVVGSLSIRNLGTIGGNIVNASPSAETAPPLLAYGAKAVVWSPPGEKQIPIEDFFTGPSSTVLGRGEILKGFALKAGDRLEARYEKLGIRKAQEIAVVNVCVAMNPTSGPSDIRIALGAVAPTPFRALKAEAYLEAEGITEDRVTEAGQIAMGEASPISDIRASADYRRAMIAVLTKTLIMSLMSATKGCGA
jgi:carbon-monoxide dehydrogenase medium subunit